MEDKILDFSENCLDLVHVHVNNYGDTNNKGYATYLKPLTHQENIILKEKKMSLSFQLND